jgi:hypothetical protein
MIICPRTTTSTLHRSVSDVRISFAVRKDSRGGSATAVTESAPTSSIRPRTRRSAGPTSGLMSYGTTIRPDRERRKSSRDGAGSSSVLNITPMPVLTVPGPWLFLPAIALAAVSPVGG